jgi:hypothetical protein
MDAPFSDDQLLLDSLNNIALTPMFIRRIFLMLVRVHYSDANHYGAYSKQLQSYVWSTRPDNIFTIEYDFNFDPTKTDKRPAIYVGTSDIEFRKVVIDNLNSQSLSRDADLSIKIAETNIVVRHIGKSADESWALGDLTCQFFLGMRKLLQERLRQRVTAFEIVKLTASKPFDRSPQQADQQFTVDLIMNFSYNASWMTLREGHRIKTVTFGQRVDFDL